MAHDVFVCYSSEDKTTADAACAKLESTGVRCWIAPRDPTPGIPYTGQIIKAITDAQIVLLIFSGHASRSEHVLRELEIASDSGKIIVPFRIEDIVPSGDLRYYITRVHWLDAMTPPMAKRLEELAALMRKLLEVPQVAAATDVGEAAVPASPKRLVPYVLIFAALCAIIYVSFFHKPTASPTPRQPSEREVHALSQGLYGYWPLNAATLPSGSKPSPESTFMPVAQDRSGHGHDGTVQDYLDEEWKRQYGHDNILLDFSDQPTHLQRQMRNFVTVPGRLNTAGSYSVSAAVLPESFSGAPRNATIVSQSGGQVGSFDLRLNEASSAELIINSSDTIEPDENTVNDSERLSGAWHNVLGVYDARAGEAMIFVDGVCRGKASVNKTFRSSGPIMIGAAKSGTTVGELFSGFIAEVRLYDHALTENEAKTLYWVTMKQLQQSPENLRSSTCTANQRSLTSSAGT
ncbi:MAG TPA: TIR domain-containing protein [Candidatus Cybelea sp.]|nr:TIR domain-containing protein [Candidatus Cybelea sp.]